MADVRIRAFEPGDVEAVAALRAATFSHTERTSRADLEAYIREVCLDLPWRDPEIPSLVAERADGAIVGFVGMLVRRMRWRRQSIRVACPSQLMVDPGHRGLTGTLLGKRMIAGAQDLIFSDAANDAARRFWPHIGGQVARMYSMFWTRPLRPYRYAMAPLGGHPVQRVARLAARPMLAAGDALAVRLDGSAYRLAPSPLAATRLEAEDLVVLWPRMAARAPLAPEYDATLAAWVVAQVDAKKAGGPLHRVLLRDAAGEPVGFYLYVAKPGDIAEVLQVAALPDRHGEVLDHLFAHAWRTGSVAVRGRMDPSYVDALRSRQCTFASDGPWTLVHARSPELLATVMAGDAWLSRLDGEYPLRF